jgi:hypothetical protein
MRLVVIGGQRPQDWYPVFVVVPGGCGHGEDALGDPGGNALECSAAALLQARLALEASLTDSMNWRTALSCGSARRTAPT